MDVSPKTLKIMEDYVKSAIIPDIEKLNRKTVNNLCYLALKNYNECSLKIVELSDELERSKKMDTNGSDSKHVFTPRKYTKPAPGTSPQTMGELWEPWTRFAPKTADWRTTGRPDTPQLIGKRVYKSQQDAREVRSTLFGESKNPYSLKKRPTTPPRKTTTRKGGKRGKNMKTMRKYFQK